MGLRHICIVLLLAGFLLAAPPAEAARTFVEFAVPSCQ
jgi:hypothetical protein